jgi:type I restriction enzyme S subunit
VTAISQHVSVIDSLEAEVRRNLAQCARLRQSILKWAFEGRLVDQDPADEPASKLLARIKAERAVEPVRSRTRRPRRTTSNGNAR